MIPAGSLMLPVFIHGLTASMTGSMACIFSICLHSIWIRECDALCCGIRIAGSISPFLWRASYEFGELAMEIGSVAESGNFTDEVD